MGSVTLAEFKAKLKTFVEEKIIPDFEEWEPKLMVGFTVSSNYVDGLINTTTAKLFGITNADGTINLDVLKQAIDGAFDAQPSIPLDKFGAPKKVMDKDVTDAFFATFAKKGKVENDGE